MHPARHNNDTKGQESSLRVTKLLKKKPIKTNNTQLEHWQKKSSIVGTYKLSNCIYGIAINNSEYLSIMSFFDRECLADYYHFKGEISLLLDAILMIWSYET